MGHTNGMAVFTFYSDLDHGPFRLLMGMALITLDKPKGNRQARVYYGGEEHMLWLCGKPHRATLYRWLRVLDARGALERLPDTFDGKHAYQLMLDPIRGPTEPP